MRILAKFSKSERIKFISHLDLVRTMQRSIRRADIPIAFSQGFNPHPIMSFASALAVGTTSQAEYMDITLEKDMDVNEFLMRLNQSLPKGLEVLEAKVVTEAVDKLMAIIDAAEYLVQIEVVDKILFHFKEEIESFLHKEKIMIVKEGKKGRQELDIKPYIYNMREISNDGKVAVLDIIVAAGSRVNIKPEQVIASLGTHINVNLMCYPIQIHRLNLFLNRNGIFVTPLEI